jgi:hypothetical protein
MHSNETITCRHQNNNNVSYQIFDLQTETSSLFFPSTNGRLMGLGEKFACTWVISVSAGVFIL